jgi:hypothetical protein
MPKNLDSHERRPCALCWEKLVDDEVDYCKLCNAATKRLEDLPFDHFSKEAKIFYNKNGYLSRSAIWAMQHPREKYKGEYEGL